MPVFWLEVDRDDPEDEAEWMRMENDPTIHIIDRLPSQYIYKGNWILTIVLVYEAPVKSEYLSRIDREEKHHG